MFSTNYFLYTFSVNLVDYLHKVTVVTNIMEIVVQEAVIQNPFTKGAIDTDVDEIDQHSVNLGEPLLQSQFESAEVVYSQSLPIRAIFRDPLLTRLGQFYVVLPTLGLLSLEDRRTIIDYCYTGNSSPLNSLAAINLANYLCHYTRAKRLTTEMVWPIIVFPLVISDYLNLRHIPFTNMQIIAGQLFFGIPSSPLIYSSLNDGTLPILSLYLAPAVIGLMNALCRIQWKSIISIENTVDQLEHPQQSFYGDSLFWILPLQTYPRALDRATSAILFDGRLNDIEREGLLKLIVRLARRRGQLAQLRCLLALGALTDSRVEAIKQIATKTLIEMSNVGSHFSLNTLARLTLANYLLWSNGIQPAQYFDNMTKFQRIIRISSQYLFFLPLHLLTWFVRYRIYAYLIEKIVNAVNYKIAQDTCVDQGGKYLLNELTNTYACKLCARWPIYFEDMQSVQGCIDGLLRESRSIKMINVLLPDVLHKKSTINSINLSNQLIALWSPNDFDAFLSNIITHFPLLRKIDFSVNPSVNTTLADSHIAILTKYFTNVSITDLALDNQVLSAVQLDRLLPSITKNTKLVRLSLSNVTLTDAALFILGDLKRCSSLSELNLANNQITDQGFANFTHYFTGKSIKLFDISNNAITMNSVASMANLVSSNSIIRLNLSGNNFQGADFSVINTTTVTAYSLSNCQLSNIELQSLTGPLSQGIVTGLDLSGNNYLDDQGLASLVSASISKPLFELNLSGTQVSGDGLAALGDNLPMIPLQVLDISNLQFSPTEFNLFIKKIVGTQLRALLVENNFLGDTGLDTIVDLLNKSKCPLNTLSLKDNNLTDKVIAQLILALEKGSITTLNLAKNELGGKAAEAMKQTILRTTLESIDLSECQISQSEFVQFYKELAISNIKRLVMDNNLLGDYVGANFIAELIAPTPQIDIVTSADVKPIDSGIIAAATSRSPLQVLSLKNVNATDATVYTICRLAYRTKLKFSNLQLAENHLISGRTIDPNSCQIRVSTQRNALGPYPSQTHSGYLGLALCIPALGLIILIILIVKRLWSSKEISSKRNDETSINVVRSQGLFNHLKTNGSYENPIEAPKLNASNLN